MAAKKPVKAPKRAARAVARKPAPTRAAKPSRSSAAPAKPKAKPAAKAAARPAKPQAKLAPAKPHPLESVKSRGTHDAPAFDPMSNVKPDPASEEDFDGESASNSSLLAGPRNVKPYVSKRGEQYMNKEQLDHFGRILQTWKRDLMVEVDRTVLHMKDEAANFPDPNDRATQEEEFSLELRTRDRERKLIRKIDEALKRIEDGSYGYCLETGEEIGIKRLEARPVATLSVEAQERRERREKQYGDRDDRYR